MQTTIKTKRGTIHASWEGGPYIDMGFSYGHPVEVLNVWDYEKDAPAIPYERNAMRAEIMKWLADGGREDLKHWREM